MADESIESQPLDNEESEEPAAKIDQP